MSKLTNKQLLDENTALRQEVSTLRHLLEQERVAHMHVAEVASAMNVARCHDPEARKQAMQEARQMALRFGHTVKVTG